MYYCKLDLSILLALSGFGLNKEWWTLYKSTLVDHYFQVVKILFLRLELLYGYAIVGNQFWFDRSFQSPNIRCDFDLDMFSAIFVLVIFHMISD